MWRAMLDRVPTQVNLNKLSADIDSILCPICGSTSKQLTTFYSIARWQKKCGDSLRDGGYIIFFPTDKSLDVMLSRINFASKDNKIKEALEAMIDLHQLL